MPDGINPLGVTRQIVVGSSPGWADGYVPPAAEWNEWWSLKLDVDSSLVTGGPYLSLSGGTLTGPLTTLSSLTLSGNPPSGPNEAVSKDYVDNRSPSAGVVTFNSRFGNVILLSSDVTTALAYTPYNSTNPAGYQDAAGVNTLIAANPSGFQTSAGVSSIVSSYAVPLTSQGIANGVATLDASGHVPSSQMPGSVTGSLTYLGGWNASTNVPALASGALSGGVLQPANRYYVVSTTGTTSIDGVATWTAGDWIVSNGTIWQRVVNSTSPYLPLVGGTTSGNIYAPGFGVGTNDVWGTLGYSVDLVYSIRDATGGHTFAVTTDGTTVIAAVPTPTMATMPAPKSYVDASLGAFLPLAGGVVSGPLTVPTASTFADGGLTPDNAFAIADGTGQVAFMVDASGNTWCASLSVKSGSVVPNPPFILPTSPGAPGTWWNNGGFICVA